MGSSAFWILAFNVELEMPFDLWNSLSFFLLIILLITGNGESFSSGSKYISFSVIETGHVTFPDLYMSLKCTSRYRSFFLFGIKIIILCSSIFMSLSLTLKSSSAPSKPAWLKFSLASFNKSCKYKEIWRGFAGISEKPNFCCDHFFHLCQPVA